METILLIGGDNENDQLKCLKNYKPKIIIGTPGRILSLSARRNGLSLKNIQIFVIDECDKMLNALGKFKIFKFIYIPF
jgi:superfamily II DNA/RNA helicase